MKTIVMERRCPKCGKPLYLLPEGGATNWGVTVIVAEKEED